MNSRNWNWNRQFNRYSRYLFILPAVVFILGFVIYPILYNLIISFYNVRLTSRSIFENFAGLDNYRAVIRMPVFGKALFNTFVFTASSLSIQFVIGFGFALFFSKTFPGSKFFRGIILICWMLPNIVTATIWKWLFAGDGSGIINFIMLKLKLISSPIIWLSSVDTAMIAVIITNIWRNVPFNMLLIATALTTLPVDIYEAAEIDGASKFKRFTKITLPLLRPTIIAVITLGFIYTFKVFELIYVMTGGGPVDATELLATITYRFTFVSFDLGLGSASATILFVILFCVGLVYLKFVAKDEVIG